MTTIAPDTPEAPDLVDQDDDECGPPADQSYPAVRAYHLVITVQVTGLSNRGPARTATRTYTRTVDITPGKTSRADVYGWARDYAVTETARTHGLGDQLTTAVLYFDLASDQLW
ncbi:hypothetical protein OG216_47905 (plasmid) [Streptomycetaceae bacterium NBC_01309]